MINGKIIAGAGFIGDAHDDLARIRIDEVQAELRWDAGRAKMLRVPLEILVGREQVAVQADIAPPRESGGVWVLSIAQEGSPSPRPASKEPPVVVERVNLRAMFDPAAKRVVMEKLEGTGRGVNATVTAALDYSGTEPQLCSSA